MSKRVKMPKVDPGVTAEIEIPGDKIYDYKAIPITIDVEEALMALEEELQDAEQARRVTPLDRVEAQLRELDIVLRPVARPKGDGNGPPEKVSELLLPAYKDGKVTAAQIKAVALDIVVAVRPT